MVFVVGALYPLTCASGIATARTLCGTCCESFHLKKKKVMYEVKQGRRNHLLLQKSVKLLLNHFCYSPHLALTD